MDVVDVTCAAVTPAACIVDQAGRVVLFDPVCDAFGIVLSPALIEWDPHNDRRVIVKGIDDILELALELSSGFR